MQHRGMFAGICSAALLLIPACAIGTGLGRDEGRVLNPVETFVEEDRPVSLAIELGGGAFELDFPWGYDRAANASRDYPIVVNGCWDESGYFTEAVRKRYPAFFLDFNNHSSESDGALLAELLDLARNGNRIDMDRVYLTGFSAGGSGSFKLVRGMLAKDKLFAAIIRVAGQSEPILADKAAEKTSLWYHIGLDDSSVRVGVARVAYADLNARAVNANAAESITNDTITGHTRMTATLTLNGVEIVKYSEYEGMGHTPGPCYQDPALFDWLFGQSLAIR